jgi:iron(III) transport system permease protein
VPVIAEDILPAPRRRLQRPRLGGWTLLALAVALPTLVPLVVTGTALIAPDPRLWTHLFDHVLPDVVANTAWLLLGVGLGTAVVGTVLAALVALCEFPGRRVFAWALLLPLAMPTYVLAVAAVGLLDYAGPVATVLREWGVGFPEIRSRGGIILVMTLALYPYVYLIARTAFASQGLRAFEAARSLGMSPLQAFLRASLPLARPWIAGGTVLVLMETLADFGAVAAFNYDTFTTAIYKAWFGMFSVDAALQIASVLLLVVLVLVALEARSRAHRVYAQLGGSPVRRVSLGRMRWIATALCTGVVVTAFLIPVLQLLRGAWWHVHELDLRYLALMGNSVTLGLVAALLTTAAGLVLAYAVRRQPGMLSSAIVRLATLGYALPGALLAIALYVPLARAAAALEQGLGTGALLQGSLVLLLMAYGVRFLAVAHAPISGALLRIRPSLDESAMLQGVGGVPLLWRVHLPLLRRGLFAAALLVFVDVMKEMPITLMTRPFGWDTLATRVFELTNEGEWARAAWPSLGILVAGLFPILWLNRGVEGASDESAA